MILNQLDCLFDDECSDDIVVYDENNNELAFEQIAVIAYNDEMYAILRPLDGECAEDEAYVYFINEVTDQLEIVNDDEIIDGVFEEYTRLIAEDEEC